MKILKIFSNGIISTHLALRQTTSSDVSRETFVVFALNCAFGGATIIYESGEKTRLLYRERLKIRMKSIKTTSTPKTRHTQTSTGVV